MREIRLKAAERAALQALAEAALPAGRVLPGGGALTVTQLEVALDGLPEGVGTGYRALLTSLQAASLLRTGRRFEALPLGRRLSLLHALSDAEATRLVVRGLLAPLKFLHFESAEAYRALGLRHVVPPPKVVEKQRWREQIVDGGAQGGDVELEVEAVVVGTGAGGAPVAATLAARGFAVLMLEEGAFHGRETFNGRPKDMLQRLYRRGGATLAMGNTVIPVPVGRGVGGTTLINSGTCFRPPEAVLTSWAARGLTELTASKLDPYFSQVETELEVGPSSSAALGAVAKIVARGADALGYSHHPLHRNAPGCDGQGLCCFGCPTDAKRSTNVSWVPRALERGAQVMTGVQVQQVLMEGDTAVGVRGVAVDALGQQVTVTVRAKVVVLACGSLHTPVLLQRQGLCNSSGQLGRNLSIHPATGAVALMNEDVDPSRTVPQGYAVDEFKAEGIYFEGATVPVEVQAASMQGFGPGFTAAMERFNQSVMFGFMVKDVSRGRVTPGEGFEPAIRYWLEDADTRRLHRGLGLLARMFFAAGAQEVLLPVAGWERLRSPSDMEAFERAKVAARHLELTAYHPLGTARMGVDPADSVVDASQEAHDVHNLFVCDGSVIPGSLGVNPQVTIMALSLRAAEAITRRLERLASLSGATGVPPTSGARPSARV